VSLLESLYWFLPFLPFFALPGGDIATIEEMVRPFLPRVRGEPIIETEVDALINETVKSYPNPQMISGNIISLGDSSLDVTSWRAGLQSTKIVPPGDGLPDTRIRPMTTPALDTAITTSQGMTNSFCPPIMCMPTTNSPMGQGQNTNLVEDLFTAWDYLKRPVTVLTLASMLMTLRLKLWPEGEDYDNEQ
jgi:hypothetical protein